MQIEGTAVKCYDLDKYGEAKKNICEVVVGLSICVGVVATACVAPAAGTSPVPPLAVTLAAACAVAGQEVLVVFGGS